MVQKRFIKKFIALILTCTFILPMTTFGQENTENKIHFYDENHSDYGLDHSHGPECDHEIILEHVHTEDCDHSIDFNNLDITEDDDFNDELALPVVKEIEEEPAELDFLPDELNDDIKILDVEIAYIASFMSKTTDEIELVESLYDINGNDAYVLIEFSSGGYAIAVKDSIMITEYSETALNPYSSISGYEKFYLGLLQYYYFNDDSLINIKTGEVLSAQQKSATFELNEAYLETANEYSDGMSLGVSSFGLTDGLSDVTKIISNESIIKNSNFGQNVNKPPKYPDGSCGPLSISILLEYYDKVHNDNFVPSNLETTSHKDDRLHAYIRDVVALTQTLGGSLSSDDRLTTNYWLGQDNSKNKLGYHAKSDLVFTDSLINSINNNNPGLLYLFNDSKYKNHVVVAYGYRKLEIDQGVFSTYFKIHSGWHGGEDCDCANGKIYDIWVNDAISYGGSMWLETYSSHTHSFKSVIHQNENMHYYICDYCNLVSGAGHTFDYVNVSGSTHKLRCINCNYEKNCNGRISVMKPSFSAYSHILYCSGCPYSRTESHSYGSWENDIFGHKRVCKECGYTESGNHNVSWYSSNLTQHTGMCFTCYKTVSQLHSFNFNGVCSACGYKKPY